jgi:hypothetical protein
MARRYTKGVDLVRAQKARFQKLKLTRETGLRDIAEAGKADAIELASGALTRSQTRGAYARGDSPANSTPTGRRRQLTARQLATRGLIGGAPMLPINVQSGKLRAGIRLVLRSPAPRLSYSLLIQNVDYARYILSEMGTKKMVSRGYKAEIQRRQKARQAAYVQFYQRQSRS